MLDTHHVIAVHESNKSIIGQTFRSNLSNKCKRDRLLRFFNFFQIQRFMPRKDVGAFTLSEVLITLGIIGVVAAITIPTLSKNIQDAQYKTAYRKAFSVASQALISANQQDLTVVISTDDASLYHVNFNAFMSEFTVTKQCTNNNNSECWDSTGELFGLDFSSGYPVSWMGAFIDKSGMAWTTLGTTQGRIGVIPTDSKNRINGARIDLY